jgi:dihydrofolate reductase
MGQIVSDISISLDGYITGPNDGPEHPLGEGGEVLHEWIFRDPDTFPQLMADLQQSTGAIVMGRWSYELANGWGEEPPFRLPVFVVTHRPHPRLEKQGGTSFTFVTDGLDSAMQQAQAAAGDRAIAIHGGTLAQQLLRTGRLDELRLHIIPVLLGAGKRFFEEGVVGPRTLELVSERADPDAVHVHYRTAR